MKFRQTTRTMPVISILINAKKVFRFNSLVNLLSLLIVIACGLFQNAMPHVLNFNLSFEKNATPNFGII